jgi:hypothetical protein
MSAGRESRLFISCNKAKHQVNASGKDGSNKNNVPRAGILVGAAPNGSKKNKNSYCDGPARRSLSKPNWGDVVIFVIGSSRYFLTLTI